MDSLGKILIASNDSNFRASMVNNLLDQFKAHAIEVLSTEAIFRKIEKEKIILLLLDSSIISKEISNFFNKFSKIEKKCFVFLFYTSEEKELIKENYPISQKFLKPIKIEQVFAFIRKYLIDEKKDEKKIILNDFHLLIHERAILNSENEVKVYLTEKETQMLAYLGRNKNKKINRKELLSDVWNYGDDITTHTLETHIYRLRKKLSSFDSKIKIIVTEDGCYLLSC